MGKFELTEPERKYLVDLKDLPNSVRSRIAGWLLELIPSIGLFVYGFLYDKRLFMLFGFLSLLYFSIWRMVSQFRGFRMIQSIYKKQLSEDE